MAKKKKYYKVVVLVPEIVQTVRKVVHVNVKKCVVQYGVLDIHNYMGNRCGRYPATFEYFIKEQKHGKIDDGLFEKKIKDTLNIKKLKKLKKVWDKVEKV